MTLTNKIALITGAGRGAGALIAKALAKKGYVIAANDITPINVEMVAAEISAAGGIVSVYIHDVAKKLDTQALINDVIDAYGTIDLLINAANIDLSADLLVVDEWDLHRVFEVNVIGAMILTQSVGRVMRAQGFGDITHILPSTDTISATQLASIAALEAVCGAAEAEFSNHSISLRSVKHVDIQDWLGTVPDLG